MMKKHTAKLIIFGLWFIMTLYMLTSCQYKPNGVRPFDYGPAKWVSESGDVWFIITGNEEPDGEDEVWPILDGGATVEGETYDCKIQFWGYHGITFWETNYWNYLHGPVRKNGEIPMGLICGDCKFGPEKLVVKVFDEESSQCFPGEKITFIRQPLESADTESEIRSSYSAE